MLLLHVVAVVFAAAADVSIWLDCHRRLVHYHHSTFLSMLIAACHEHIICQELEAAVLLVFLMVLMFCSVFLLLST